MMAWTTTPAWAFQLRGSGILWVYASSKFFGQRRAFSIFETERFLSGLGPARANILPLVKWRHVERVPLAPLMLAEHSQEPDLAGPVAVALGLDVPPAGGGDRATGNLGDRHGQEPRRVFADLESRRAGALLP